MAVSFGEGGLKFARSMLLCHVAVVQYGKVLGHEDLHFGDMWEASASKEVYPGNPMLHV